MDLESMYQEIILDHYKHPHGRGLRDPYDTEVHHVNPSCGDELTVRVLLTAGSSSVVPEALQPDDLVITDVSYDGLGCSISQASVSVMYELLVGHTVADGMSMQQEFLRLMQGRGKVEPDEDVLGDGIAFAGVAKYPARVKCALLGWMAWKDAVAQAMGDNEKSRVNA